VETSRKSQLLGRVAAAEPIAHRLKAIRRGEGPVAFWHVLESARSFLVAVIAQQIPKTLWVICPSVRSQELLHESLTNWLPGALFLPEAEFLAVENILPDQEIAAERLALLSRVEHSKERQVIVATRASLDQPAPKRGALQAAALRLRRGAAEPLERMIDSLGKAGYERVVQITTRGQFAVRGGILDVFSWQAPAPTRAEFFGDEIESLREFDLDTQISQRNLNEVELLLARRTTSAGRCAITSRRIISGLESRTRRKTRTRFGSARDGLEARMWSWISAAPLSIARLGNSIPANSSLPKPNAVSFSSA
jgi:transcription-repair coupling factor (superfamily II helicase)